MKQSPAGLMTMAEYSRHRKVNRSYVTRLAQRGILILRGRLVDVAASDAVLDDRPLEVEPQAPPPSAPRAVADSLGGQQPPSSYAQAKTVDMVYRAKLRKLELDARQQKVIDAALVEARWAAILVVLKERALAVPDRLAPEIAALSDERQVRDVLKREMHLLSKTLSQEVRYAN